VTGRILGIQRQKHSATCKRIDLASRCSTVCGELTACEDLTSKNLCAACKFRVQSRLVKILPSPSRPPMLDKNNKPSLYYDVCNWAEACCGDGSWRKASPGMCFFVTLLHCPPLSQYDCCLPIPCIRAQTMQHCQHPHTASNFSNLT
jgi:hypothetical protein